MKKSFISLYSIINTCVGLVLCSCAEEIVKKDKVEVLVPFNIAAVESAAITRTSSNIQSTNFESGEPIKVYVTMNGATNNETRPTDGTNFYDNPLTYTTGVTVTNGVNPLTPPVPEGESLYFPPGDNVTTDIYALYPSRVTNILTKFEVAAEQTSDDIYKDNDLMYAQVTGREKSSEVIHLQFAHKMAKIIFNITGEDGVKIKEARLMGIKTTIGFNVSSGELAENPDDTPISNIIVAQGKDENEEIVAKKELHGAALIPPQTIGGDNPGGTGTTVKFIEVDTEYNGSGIDHSTALFFIDSKKFTEGSQYTINLFVGPKNLVNGNSNDGDVYITNWNDALGTLTVAAVGSSGLEITEIQNCERETEGDEHTYDSTAHNPKATVTDGKKDLEGNDISTPLTEGSDYTLSYYNDTNAGTALLVATGIGDYEGMTAVKPFTIQKAVSDMHYTESEISLPYAVNGIVDNPIVNKGNGNFTYNSSDTNIADIDDYGVITMKGYGGPITITASMDDSGNFEAKDITFNLTVEKGKMDDPKRPITIEFLTPFDYTYTGEALEPPFKVTQEEQELTNGIDFTYAYSNNIDAGINTAVLTITGAGKYDTSTKLEKYFTINMAENNILTMTDSPTDPLDCGVSRTCQSSEKVVSVPAQTYSVSATAKFGTVKYRSNSNKATVNETSGLVTAVSPTTGESDVEITAYVEQVMNSNGTYNYSATSKSINVKVEQMSFIYLYNGTTNASSSNQQIDGTYQTFNRSGKNTKQALFTFTLVGAGGGNDGGGLGGGGGQVVVTRVYDTGSEDWYIYCGGGGTTNTTGTGAGWNGGGHPGAGSGGSSGAGGGATDIRLGGHGTGCTLTGYETLGNPSPGTTDHRILVAGGGGGASVTNSPGKDGGLSDSGGYGTKWKGQDKTSVTPGSSRIDGGGGGGGYLGGTEGGDGASGGSGGSNYIDSAFTILYNGSSTTKTSPYTDYSGTMWNNAPTDGNSKIMWPGFCIITYRYTW